jgi:hypothetical protein
MNLQLDNDRYIYFDADADQRAAERYFTLFCGGCGEEIDVAASTLAEARRIGEAAIERDYEPIKIDHIEPRYRGLTYF